jgi:hypothetical protein
MREEFHSSVVVQLCAVVCIVYATELPCMHCQDVLDKRCPLGYTVLLLRNNGLLPPTQERFQEHAAHTNITQRNLSGKRQLQGARCSSANNQSLAVITATA